MKENMRNDILNKLTHDIQNRIFVSNYRPKIYIGKTDDIEMREKEHEKEGYAYTLHLASGPSDSISELETDLIQILRHVDWCEVSNKQSASAGNPKATELYICLYELHPNDSLGEYDVKTFLGSEYPLDLKKL